MKAEGAWTALINHASGFINQINPVGPTRVGLLCSVAEVIHERRKFDSKLAHAHIRNLSTLSHAFWTGEDNFVTNIALHLPNVAGMGFQNVDSVKLHALTIFIVELV